MPSNLWGDSDDEERMVNEKLRPERGAALIEALLALALFMMILIITIKVLGDYIRLVGVVGRVASEYSRQLNKGESIGVWDQELQDRNERD